MSYLNMVKNNLITLKICVNEDGTGRSYYEMGNDLIIDGCNFFRNTIFNEDGGVILVANNNLNISDSTFVNCSANKDGGAIKLTNGNFKFFRCCAAFCAVYTSSGSVAYVYVKSSMTTEHLSFMECSRSFQSYHTLSISSGSVSLTNVNGSKTINGVNAFGFFSNLQALTLMFVSIMHNMVDGKIVTIMEYTAHDISYINFVNNTELTVTHGLICFDKIFFDPGPGMLEKTSNGRILDIGGYLINNIVVLDTVGLLFYLNAEFNLQIHNGHFGNIGTATANGVFETINCISGNPTLLSISHYYKNGCQIGDQQLPDKTLEVTPVKTYEETPVKTFEETPMKSFEETPVKTFEETPVKTFKETPMKSFEETPVKTFEETPMRTFEETPMQTFEETPMQTFEETPMKSFEETPVKTFEETPVKTFEETPVKTFEETPMKSFKETPMKTFEETPMITIEETPANSFNNQNTSNSVLYSLSITIGTILTVSMIAFGVSYFLKGKMDEPFNSDDNNLDI